MARKRLNEKAIINRMKEEGFREVPEEMKSTGFYKKLSQSPACFNQIQKNEAEKK